MLYRFVDGRTYDVSTFSSEEKGLYDWIKKEADVAKSYSSFNQRTAHGIIEAAKRLKGKEWMNHPLHKIQLDLTERVGIDLGELSRR